MRPDPEDYRLPDFIIIGTMKSGTTSLYSWLNQQPDFLLPDIKEPNFFSRDEVWGRGLSWYSRLFSTASADQFAGEASVSYSSPRFSEVAASRMWSVLPTVKLIYMLRHPIERMRSHYRHEVQRGREPLSFAEAIRVPDSAYVKQSLYHACLEPYIQTFPREQICVLRFEDLVTEPHVGWSRILSHIGAPTRPAPATRHNVTSLKGRYTRSMLWLWESGWTRFSSRVPRPARRVAKRLLIRGDKRYLDKMDGSHGPIPEEVLTKIGSDISQLQTWIGGDPLWQGPGGAAQRETIPPLQERSH